MPLDLHPGAAGQLCRYLFWYVLIKHKLLFAHALEILNVRRHQTQLYGFDPDALSLSYPQVLIYEVEIRLRA